MPWDDTSDSELFKNLQKQDLNAFRTIANRYAPMVFRCLRHHVGDHSRAAWITELILARFLVRARSAANPSIEDLFKLTANAIASGLSDAPGTGLSKKQIGMLETLSLLPVMERIIVEMVRFEGAPPDVVSRRLNCTPERITEALDQLDRLTGQAPAIPKRRPVDESRPRRPSPNLPQQRPRPETRRYYNTSDRDRRRQH